MSYFQAEEFCRSEGSYLVEIQSQMEQNFLEGLIGDSRYYVWIGLQDKTHNQNWHHWNSGAPVLYSNWRYDQPQNENGDQYCSELRNGADWHGMWNDYSCRSLNYFVCERGGHQELSYIPSDDGHCYTYVQIAMNYSEAEEFCHSKGSYLVEIESQMEQNFLEGLVGDSNVWIGLQDKTHNQNWLQWNSGTPVLYSNWNYDQPNGRNVGQYCSELRNGADFNGKWCDYSCESHKNFVCEQGSRKASAESSCNVNCQLKKPVKCYTYHKEEKNHAEAHAVCQSEGGHLMEIGSAWEQSFLQGMIRKAQVWVGMEKRDDRGPWRNWQSGSSVVYSNWADSDISEFCAGTGDTGLWHDYPCNQQYRFVCENITHGIPDMLTCNCGIGPVLGTITIGNVEMLCSN